MIAQERKEKLEAWRKSLGEDEKVFYALVIRAFDEFIERVGTDNYDMEMDEILRLIAAERYRATEDSGLAAFFIHFTEGALAGVEIGTTSADKEEI